MNESIAWKIINQYFIDNPQFLVNHHISSYNEFMSDGIVNIFRDNNPWKFETRDSNGKIDLFIGGKDGKSMYFSKPIIYDKNSTTYMYPNLARLRNMSYMTNIYVDILAEITENGVMKEYIFKEIRFCSIPIMLQSNLCILKNLPPQTKFEMGECATDQGGYFIISGKEKVVLPQQTFADNTCNVKIHNKSDKDYTHSVSIRSVSEDPSKQTRTTSVLLCRETATIEGGNILVNIPNVKKPMPLFIVMRALGMISDYDIIKACLMDMDKNENMIDLFCASVYDANVIFDRMSALQYIATFTKRGSVDGVIDIFANYMLTHLGDINYIDKAFFIGKMVYKLLKVFNAEELPTDRDSFLNKRVLPTGQLLYNLFREYYLIQKKEVQRKIDIEYYYHTAQYTDRLYNLLDFNIDKYFEGQQVSAGLMKAFKGSWGATTHTFIEGVVQDLNRLSYFTFICHLRKLILQIDSTAKVVSPRHLNSSTWGYTCCVNTPDGASIGLVLHLAMTSTITKKTPKKVVVDIIKEYIQPISNFYNDTSKLLIYTSVLVNGEWMGITLTPLELCKVLRDKRRNKEIHLFTSIQFNIKRNEIYILTDSGRLVRPVYYIDDNGKGSWDNYKDELNWNEIEGSVVEYIDSSESEGALICSDIKFLGKQHTHMEIDNSLILGEMGNMIPFPDHSQFPRNVFSCNQGRQGASVYSSNYLNRMDTAALVLDVAQNPLVHTKYSKYIIGEKHPYGCSAMVAIASYTSYNVEDAILINKASLDRGLFHTTYYSTYQSFEEIDEKTGVITSFTDVKNSVIPVSGIKAKWDYNHLDNNGIIREGTKLTDNIVLIGKTKPLNATLLVDMSISVEKGTEGYVDKVYLSYDEMGKRIVKVRVRQERIPAMGDKFASRAGQKGTCGRIVSEEDMPFTANGLRPDLIINPHAIPSRMTINQLIEGVLGKACLLNGGYGDCTAFKGNNNLTEIGKVLNKYGFHSQGDELMYSGFNGGQLETNIFFTPTYYLRLKPQTRDKINYRSKGPNEFLTRQPLSGRSRDGGLKLGQMELNCISAHGITKFYNESTMEKSDLYETVINRKTGKIAKYNEDKNIYDDNDLLGSNTFAKVRMPYTFKLLMQELETANISTKLIVN
jgi:DNA-directed RNA polymerase II subunit RPB2